MARRKAERGSKQAKIFIDKPIVEARERLEAAESAVVIAKQDLKEAKNEDEEAMRELRGLLKPLPLFDDDAQHNESDED